MLEIVNKIEELYALLTKRLSEVEKLKSNLVSETARLDGKEASLQNKASELSARASFIGEVESIKELRMKTDVAIEAGGKELAKLVADKKAIFDNIVSERASLADERVSVKSNIEALKAKESSLAVANKKLEDDKKNYKEQIIREIGKKI